MSKALSVDLRVRVRVLAAVAEGLMHRQVGERFGVSAASVSRWRRLSAIGAMRAPVCSAATGVHRFSSGMARRSWRSLQAPGTSRSPRSELPWKPRACAPASLRSGGFWTGMRSRSKKSAHVSEQDRPDILKRRQDWVESQPDLDPARLVFIDETPDQVRGRL